MLDLLAVEQAVVSKCLDVERDAHDVTYVRIWTRCFGSW